MKFLPPAAAAQLTQKSSKAVDNAAAVAEVLDLRRRTLSSSRARLTLLVLCRLLLRLWSVHKT